MGGRAAADYVCAQRFQPRLHVQRHRAHLLRRPGRARSALRQRRRPMALRRHRAGFACRHGGWVNTGLGVAGPDVLFNTTGEVRLSSDERRRGRSGRIEEGSLRRHAPMPSSLAGALIGRIGNGAPFGIGNQTSIPAPGTGSFGWRSTTTCWATTPASSASTITGDGSHRRRRHPAALAGREC